MRFVGAGLLNRSAACPVEVVPPGGLRRAEGGRSTVAAVFDVAVDFGYRHRTPVPVPDANRWAIKAPASGESTPDHGPGCRPPTEPEAALAGTPRLSQSGVLPN